MQQRQIVLDTETTGLDVSRQHRVIEIGGVELVNRRHSGKHFHCYLQPDREIDSGAYEVHGISAEFLADKPRFAEIAGDFIAFIKDAELVIHNAPFDVSFLDYELSLLGNSLGTVADYCTVLDTLAMARRLHPGQRNSLDALCKRYGVENSQRTLHGALLDAEILADVYLLMTGGQVNLTLEAGVVSNRRRNFPSAGLGRGGRRPLAVVRASAEERAAHEQYLDALDKSSKGQCVWRRIKTG